MQKFKNQYKIQNNPTPVSEEILKEYKDKVPKALLDLWKQNGFGKYNDGIIELVNPKNFESVLWTWLGREVDNYVPFAITAFGELLYYRKLTETDEDVCIIDIQLRNIETLEWDLEVFFDEMLTDEKDVKGWLREELLHQAIVELGPLAQEEIFTVAPVVVLGGKMELEYLKKGNAQVYQDLIFQMAM